MIKVPENFILRVIRNSQRAKVPQTVIKTQQVPSEGAVAVVAEGTVKPLLQYKFQRTSTSRKNTQVVLSGLKNLKWILKHY